MKTRARWILVSLAVFLSMTLGLPVVQGQPPAVSWTPANPMNRARAFFVAVELQNGNVLVAGGYDGRAFFVGGPPVFADSEIYDWHTGAWMPTAPMNQARAAPVAVRLEDGRVLVIGGVDENFNVLDSAEIYDPASGTWSITGSMNDARQEDFTAVLLPGRKVLVAGGYANGFIPLKSAEIYDETTGTWTRTGSMNVGRGEFATLVLHNRRVLAIGGETQDGPSPTATAEIFDPVTESWTLTGSMDTGREDHSAVRLLDGRVLVAGGGTVGGARVASAEVFDPRTGQWAPTGDMTSPRNEAEFATVLLPDGQVLVPGGFVAFDSPVSSADLYDPGKGTWTQAAFMSVARAGHSAIVLRGSRGVLMMGGLSQPPLATASVDIAIQTP